MYPCVPSSKLKEGVAVQEQLTVDSDLPLLVKNVIKSFQPVVKLEKVEANCKASLILCIELFVHCVLFLQLTSQAFCRQLQVPLHPLDMKQTILQQ